MIVIIVITFIISCLLFLSPGYHGYTSRARIHSAASCSSFSLLQYKDVNLRLGFKVNRDKVRFNLSLLSMKDDQPQPIDNKNKASGYSMYQCISCSYVYDEEKGFKKRYPPGTKFDDLKTFACPVCGAAKDQFKIVQQQSV